MSAPDQKEYVLGTGNDELERLGLQNRLWADATHALWKVAGIGPGQRVLDIGCGPGYAAFDLANFVQGKGRVVGIDESAAFTGFVTAQAKARGLPQVTARIGDAQDLAASLTGEAPFDLAYARWVLCFVPHPDRVVQGAAEALRKGGRFVVQDYFNYTAMTMGPRRASYAKVVEATARSWRAHGGDPDVVARLPRLLRDAGMKVIHLAQQQRVARPGESMWNWVDSWWTTYVPKLVTMGELTQQDAAAFFADWRTMDAEVDFAVLPTVWEVVAEKT